MGGLAQGEAKGRLMRKRNGAVLLLTPATGWFGLFFALPLAAMAVVSFWVVVNYQLVPRLVLDSYAKLAQSLYLSIILRTFLIATTVTVLSALVGYPVAYYLARRAKRLRVLILTLVVLPLWTSYLVRSFAWMLVLGTSGVLNGFLQATGVTAQPIRWFLYSEFAVIIALVHVYLPYFILPVFAVLEKLDHRLVEASEDLGARPWTTFWTVTLPLSRPGIVTGSLLVFIPAAGAYVTPELLGGPNVIMIGSVIAQQFGLVYEYPFGAALALALLAGILAVALGLLRLGQIPGVK
jgi:spermidine/putrescine transport system permease protein